MRRPWSEQTTLERDFYALLQTCEGALAASQELLDPADAQRFQAVLDHAPAVLEQMLTFRADLYAAKRAQEQRHADAERAVHDRTLAAELAASAPNVAEG